MLTKGPQRFLIKILEYSSGWTSRSSSALSSFYIDIAMLISFTESGPTAAQMIWSSFLVSSLSVLWLRMAVYAALMESDIVPKIPYLPLFVKELISLRINSNMSLSHRYVLCSTLDRFSRKIEIIFSLRCHFCWIFSSSSSITRSISRLIWSGRLHQLDGLWVVSE